MNEIKLLEKEFKNLNWKGNELAKLLEKDTLTFEEKEHIKNFAKRLREFIPRLSSNPFVDLEPEKEKLPELIILMDKLEKLL